MSVFLCFGPLTAKLLQTSDYPQDLTCSFWGIIYLELAQLYKGSKKINEKARVYFGKQLAVMLNICN